MAFSLVVSQNQQIVAHLRNIAFAAAAAAVRCSRFPLRMLKQGPEWAFFLSSHMSVQIPPAVAIDCR